MSTKSLKYACVLYYLCAKKGYMQQVFEFYFDGTFCKTPETRRNVFHIVWLLPFGFLLKIKIMMEQIFILVWVQHHTSHSLTKLLDLNAHVTFCLISFHLHILLTYYVAIHYVWIQLCRELITCFNVYVDVCCVAFLYIWLPFVCLFFLFVCFVPTHFVFFPVSCHCHSDTRMHFAQPSLEHAGR